MSRPLSPIPVLQPKQSMTVADDDMKLFENSFHNIHISEDNNTTNNGIINNINIVQFGKLNNNLSLYDKLLLRSPSIKSS